MLTTPHGQQDDCFQKQLGNSMSGRSGAFFHTSSKYSISVHTTHTHFWKNRGVGSSAFDQVLTGKFQPHPECHEYTMKCLKILNISPDMRHIQPQPVATHIQGWLKA